MARFFPNSHRRRPNTASVNASSKSGIYSQRSRGSEKAGGAKLLRGPERRSMMQRINLRKYLSPGVLFLLLLIIIDHRGNVRRDSVVREMASWTAHPHWRQDGDAARLQVRRNADPARLHIMFPIRSALVANPARERVTGVRVTRLKSPSAQAQRASRYAIGFAWKPTTVNVRAMEGFHSMESPRPRIRRRIPQCGGGPHHRIRADVKS